MLCHRESDYELGKKSISQAPAQHRKLQFCGVRAAALGRVIIAGLLFFFPTFAAADLMRSLGYCFDNSE